MPTINHSSSTTPLVAVDIGNSRVKFGLFEPAPSTSAGLRELPFPSRMLELASNEDCLDQLGEWLAPHSPTAFAWWVGSVARPVASQIVNWLRLHEVDAITMLSASDLPLTVSLPRPDMVGIDRLLAAVAANRLRDPGRPAITVDLGTAVTVDLVSAEGAFLGGAILPGIGLSLRALHEFTDLLPLVEMAELADPPPALGRSTVEALHSGIYWGAVGGVRQLIGLLSTPGSAEPHVYVTGGAAPAVAGLLSQSAAYVPHLTLAGIALVAGH